jgi:hypothetical protein
LRLERVAGPQLANVFCSSNVETYEMKTSQALQQLRADWPSAGLSEEDAVNDESAGGIEVILPAPRASRKVRFGMANSAKGRLHVQPQPILVPPLGASPVIAADGAWHQAPPDSRISTRIGVGLKPLQGLLTCGQLEMTNSTFMSTVTST